MNYIVMDLEWNQCPTGKQHENKKLPFEIIEIGAVRLDDSHNIVDTFHEIVRPQLYTKLHFRTREIVTLKDVDLTSARYFSEVAKDFFAWCGEDPCFCTWGPADLIELQRNVSYHHVNYTFAYPLMYYDIQKIFSIIYEDRKTRRSLEYAVDFLNITKDISFHNALSDARYTARIMKFLEDSDIQKHSSVDYYHTPNNRKQEIHLRYETYEKFVSKPFPAKTAAMKDRAVAVTRCFCCHKTIQKKLRWFASGSSNYCCLAYCDTHGYMKGKIRLRQREDGLFYAVKTTKMVSEEEAYEIRERKEIQKLKRKLRREFTSKKV